MKFPFYYSSNGFDIKSISIVGDFNNWDSSKNILQRYDDKTWMTEIELLSGNYKYKFLINDNIFLNDPNALIYTYDDKGNTVSFISIGENNKRFVKAAPASLNIESYSFSVVDKELLSCESKERKCYKDKHSGLAVKIGFTGITGLHTINAIWYSPNNEIYEIQESVLEDSEKIEDGKAEALFQININDDTCEGEWKLQVFINGAYTLEDSFTVELKQPEIEDNTASVDASMFADDTDIPYFSSVQSSYDGFASSESEAETDLKTGTENEEELSGEELLDLFDDIKEIDISASQKADSSDNTEVPNDSSIMNLFDEIRTSGPKESPSDMTNEALNVSNTASESDSGIDELLELKEFINSSQSSGENSEHTGSAVKKSDEADDEENIHDIFKELKDITD
ncbi:MAG TPA: glycoside hydrolase [Acetivibrio sp.]|uniref:glycoside hydrolase n=1 Tax=Acetivibrio sp. TaxID=1872092 RepID=UPI002BEA6981|nr:glycoside hydrolase [Acetivibrio sp.]HOM02739.1 glycoside hydrolase [Acetivibrio sp.]